MNRLDRIQKWVRRIPCRIHIAQMEVHSSLLATLAALSILLMLISFTRSSFHELQPAVITLPIVWLISLLVRMAAQQLSVGVSAQACEIVVGPTGNISTDYEYLNWQAILRFSLAGQLATFGLVLLGLVVGAAMMPVDQAPLTVARLFDFRSGWSSQAWASQIMWVNIFIACLHFLPAMPFDMRALIYAVLMRQRASHDQPAAFRTLSAVNSHVAAVLLGCGLLALLLTWVDRFEVMGWYAALAAAVYLFVAGRWEISRAAVVEAEYAPLTERRQRRDSPYLNQPHFDIAPAGGKVSPELNDSMHPTQQDASMAVNESRLGDEVEDVDIDEILRKIHRDGRESLSMREQQALISASRELKARRGLSS